LCTITTENPSQFFHHCSLWQEHTENTPHLFASNKGTELEGLKLAQELVSQSDRFQRLLEQGVAERDNARQEASNFRQALATSREELKRVQQERARLVRQAPVLTPMRKHQN
jgi:hypothetical protein